MISVSIAFMGVLVSLVGDSKFMIWAGMELNTFGFVGLVSVRKSEVASLVKYVLVQVLGSSAIFLSFMVVLSFSNFSVVDELGYFLVLVGIMCKLGLFPFHSWFPSVVASMDWFLLMWLLIIQKLSPLMLMGFMCYDSSVVLCSCLFTSFIGAVGGLDKTGVKNILAYSSLLNMGWICLCVVGSLPLFLLYFVLYSFQVFSCLAFLWVVDLKKLSGGVSSEGVILGVLGISSIPPFMLFFLKLSTVSYFLVGHSLVVIGLILSSLLGLSYYVRASVLFLMNSNYYETRVSMFFYMYSFIWIVVYSVFGILM
nr:NADH dehydrogenase subunit 2 [Vignadula atrata]